MQAVLIGDSLHFSIIKLDLLVIITLPRQTSLSLFVNQKLWP